MDSTYLSSSTIVYSTRCLTQLSKKRFKVLLKYNYKRKNSCIRKHLSALGTGNLAVVLNPQQHLYLFLLFLALLTVLFIFLDLFVVCLLGKIRSCAVNLSRHAKTIKVREVLEVANSLQWATFGWVYPKQLKAIASKAVLYSYYISIILIKHIRNGAGWRN